MNLPFDPTQYECVRAPVVDEFEYQGGGTGAVMSAKIDKTFLDRCATNMNAKFARTGDLAPIVIGHTVTGAPETEQPPLVGYLHNYSVEPYDGRHALFADHWIRKQNKIVVDRVEQNLSAKDIVERWPRRSGEVWLKHAEVDPVSLLGATTPHRPLGLLKLAADGDASLGYTAPGDLKMADTAPPQTGDFAKLTALIEQVAAMQGQTLELLQSALAQPQQHGEGDEHDLDKFLEGLDSDDGDKGSKEEPKKEEKKEEKEEPAETPEPKEDEKVKLARERDDALAKFARLEITSKLERMKAAGADIDPGDEQTIQDLMAQPADMRERTLARLQRGARKLPGATGGGFGAAVNEATADNGKRMTTEAEKNEVIKLARKEQIPFEQAARKAGYTL